MLLFSAFTAYTFLRTNNRDTGYHEMPTYEFKNKETNEVFTKVMTIAEMEEFVREHPENERYYSSAPRCVDPTRIGGKKPDEGFRDVLKNIHSKHKGSNINTW